MSDESNEVTIKIKKEVVVLTDSSIQKVNGWLEQIRLKKKGVQISRKELLNWLIEKTPETLPSGDLNTVIAKFYDEEVFLRQLLREVQKAKAEGQTDYSLGLVVRPKKTDLEKDDVEDEKNSN